MGATSLLCFTVWALLPSLEVWLLLVLCSKSMTISLLLPHCIWPSLSAFVMPLSSSELGTGESLAWELIHNVSVDTTILHWASASAASGRSPSSTLCIICSSNFAVMKETRNLAWQAPVGHNQFVSLPFLLFDLRAVFLVVGYRAMYFSCCGKFYKHFYESTIHTLLDRMTHNNIIQLFTQMM